MKRFILVMAISILFPPAAEGAFLSLRGGISQGKATYASAADSASGWNVDFATGWRPGRFLKFGLLGEFENNALSDASGPIGPMTFWSYGGFARLFFVPDIFLEGAGGLTQTRLAVNASGFAADGSGTFYEFGSGLEIPTSDTFSLEVAIRLRQAQFPGNEFQDTSSVFYSAGFTVYFR